jgi:hypothetical protein
MARIRAWLLGGGLLAGIAMAFVGLSAAPASAHGTAQVPATDYVVQVHSMLTPIPGVTLRAVDNGARFELRNVSGSDVVVLGYDPTDEPYLRIGPDGVFENVHSPAVFWNKSAFITSVPPAQYDARLAPEWRKLSSGHVARWHDHRAHYLGGAPSAGASPVVLRWTLPIEYSGHRETITGDDMFVRPSSALPYLALAAVVAVGLFAAARRRSWPTVLAVSLAVLVGAAVVQALGEWNAVTLAIGSRIGEHVYVFAGVALGIAAFVWVLRRRGSPFDATPIALLAGLALLLASGLTGLPLLTHSEIPTTLPFAVDRTLIALTIGTGAAVVAIAATKLRPPFQARPARPQESSTATEILRSMYAEK